MALEKNDEIDQTEELVGVQSQEEIETDRYSSETNGSDQSVVDLSDEEEKFINIRVSAVGYNGKYSSGKRCI